MPVHPFIDPVALTLGPLKMHWYGLMYLVGFLAFWWLGILRARRSDTPLNPQQVGDLLFWGVLGVIVGGRLGYLLVYNFPALLDNPLIAIRIWEGGMAFHGGLIGVLVVIAWYAHRLGISFLRLGDFVAPLIPIGLGAGRIGNWINGELWGKPTDLPWAMVFPAADFLPRHPSQLYQAFLEGFVLFVVLWWVSRKPRPVGLISGLFLLLYGSFRFVVEFVRVPDAHLGYLALNWVTMGQILSLPVILAGAVLVAWALRKPGMPESGIPKSGAPESGMPKSSAPKSSAPESGAPESGAPESGTPKSGAPKSSAPESGAPESGAPESGTPKSGAPKSGTLKSGTAKSGTLKSGTAKSKPGTA